MTQVGECIVIGVDPRRTSKVGYIRTYLSIYVYMHIYILCIFIYEELFSKRDERH